MENKGKVLFVILAIGIAAIFFLTRTEKPPKSKVAVGLNAPAFELRDTEGKVWRLSDLKGKTVFLHFWATWCDICRMENPSIQSLVESERENSKFVFISVLFRDEPSRVVEYMKANGLNFTVLIDDKNIAAAYGIRGIPETFVINRDGIIKRRITGLMMWDSPEAIMKLIADGS